MITRRNLLASAPLCTVGTLDPWSTVRNCTLTEPVTLPRGSTLANVTIVANWQRQMTTHEAAIKVVGPDVTIRNCKVVNWDNAFYSKGNNNVSIEGLEIESYRRGVYMANARGCSIRDLYCHKRSPFAGQDPGHNGLLLGDMTDSAFSDIRIFDSGEHGVRVGGKELINRLTFSNIVVQRAGQCGFKMQGGVLVNPQGITISGLEVKDCSYGNRPGTNEDGLRIMNGSTINVANVSVENCYDGIYIHNSGGVNIVGPRIHNCHRHGIHLDDQDRGDGIASQIYIHSPRITRTRGDAIRLNLSNSIVTDIVMNDVYARAIKGHVVDSRLGPRVINTPLIEGVWKSNGAGLFTGDSINLDFRPL